jgi:hypothetical protein
MLGTSDLRFFVAIAAAPSLAAAARALDVTPPAVSQRLAQIEEWPAARGAGRGLGSTSPRTAKCWPAAPPPFSAISTR